jgi:Flp pilus assembly protein TadG
VYADSRELGQTLPLVIVFLVVLLLMCGAVVDIGNAYRAQDALQASADAAATAAADNLPNTGAASAAGHDFSSEPGGKNTVPGVSNVNTNIVTNCATSPKFCDPANTVQVTETGSVPTYFLKILGINSIPETVHATACSPCGGVPLDIMIVLDRTGSMNQNNKLVNAKQGILAFLGSLDPTIDNVGLAVLPPAPAPGTDCNIPTSNSYNSLNSQYLMVPLSSGWGSEVNNQVQLDQNSPLLSTLNCIQAGGQTAYADAIDAAQQELNTDGRPGVQQVIVFLSDGAANTGPTYYPATSPYRTQPCQQGVNSAADAKGQGTLVYSILYDSSDGSPLCGAQGGGNEQPQMYSNQAMQQIASSGNFYDQPNPTQLTTIFLAISADLTAGTSRLTG